MTFLYNIRLTPYELLELQQLEIKKAINEHDRLYFKGLVNELYMEKYISDTDTGMQVSVAQTGGLFFTKPVMLFKGVVTGIKITRGANRTVYIEVEAISNTYQLDVKRRNRSFQDVQLTYKKLVENVLADYPESEVKICKEATKKTNELIVQYQETDWQFLKRMASRFHMGLIPLPLLEKPHFYFGLFQQNEAATITDFSYSIKKQLADFQVTAANDNPQLLETDYIFYELETDQPLGVGEPLKFMDRTLYVAAVTTKFVDRGVKHFYRLAPKGGLNQNTLDHEGLAGVSLQGKVIEVAKDKVKVHLAIDEQQPKNKAYWFPYASVYTAEGNSGWHCMPELGDYVRVYFPERQEKTGLAISSVRMDLQEGNINKLGNPDIKYFRTKSGNELMFSPGEILLSAKDGEIFVRLNDQEGIEIHSQKGIKLWAKEDLEMEAVKQVKLAATKEFKISCQGSQLVLNGETVLKGKNDKSN